MPRTNRALTGGLQLTATATDDNEEGEEEGEEGEDWEEGEEVEGGEEEAFGAWGFKDSKFIVSGGEKTVVMKGNRYSIGGRKLPKLVPFLEKEMKTKIDLTGREVLPAPRGDAKITSLYEKVGEGQLGGEAKRALEEICGSENCKFGSGVEELVARVRHNFGHAQSDIYRMRTGEVGRVPDGVIWVECEEQVVGVVKAAKKYDICLIPFGGGTNVAEMLRCNEDETRPIVSIDMRKMDTVLWINEEDGLACIEAGATGRKITKVLSARGFTMGHEPDSFEFSTLGGWVATKASGMKKNKYGNIEDIVRGVSGVDGSGSVIRSNYGGSGVGRSCSGMDIKDVLLGSEGGLAVITRCVVKVEKLPESTGFESVLFEEFECGVGFMRDMSGKTNKPVSVRLVDNEQFRLGMVMKGGATEGLLATSLKRFALWWYGFNTSSIVGVTLKYEGSVDEVEAQRGVVRDLAKKWGGLLGGEAGGRAGYELTFAIAYLRDFAMTHGLIGESFETFVQYSKLVAMVDAVKMAVKQEGRSKGLCGDVLCSARVTQLYGDGACVYFYVLIDGSGLTNASATFDSIERLAREVILEYGGSLSHHHGIGKHRAGFLKEIGGEGVGGLVKAVKGALDPDGLFGSKNGHLAGVE